MTRRRFLLPFALPLALCAFASPSTAQTTAGKAAAKPAARKSALLDINTASKTDLMMLSGVDGASADRIINGRPFTKKHQLVSRKIVSHAVYDLIKDQIIAKQATK